MHLCHCKALKNLLYYRHDRDKDLGKNPAGQAFWSKAEDSVDMEVIRMLDIKEFGWYFEFYW